MANPRKNQQLMDLLNFNLNPEEQQSFNMTAPENLMIPEQLPPPELKKPAMRQPNTEAQVPPQTSTVNPIIREHIKAKYGLIDPEAYDAQMLKAQEEAKERKSGLGLAQFAAGLGESLAGRSPLDAVRTFEGYKDNIDKETVGNLESRRRAQMDNLSGNSMLEKMQREQDELMQDSDPNSNVSQSYQQLAKKMLPSRNWSGVPASEIKRVLPSIEKLYSIQENSNQRREMANILAGKNAAKLQAESSLQGRLSKLGAEGKQRLDNAMMAYRAVKDMRNALNNGDWTVSLTENDFTDAKGRYIEGIGRMQSGGQIGAQEKKDFAGFVPGAMHDKAMQSKKLDNAEREMLRRIKTLGFDPEELEQDAKMPSPSPGQSAFDIDAIDAVLKSRGEL